MAGELEGPGAPVGVDCMVGSAGNAVRVFGWGRQLEGSLRWPPPMKLEGDRDMMG